MVESSGEERDQLGEIVEVFLRNYLIKIKSEGLKNVISKATSKGLDYFILGQVKKHLSPKRVIRLGKGFGMIDVQYKKGGIELDPCGFIRLLIKKIVVGNSQILHAVDSIIDQFEKKYIDNPDYIIERVNRTLKQLSDVGIYKPKTSEEKTIYDLALLIVLNYYKNDSKRPKWVEAAINNLKIGEFIEDWIEAILEHIYAVVSNMSENLYFDFKITFDSPLVRAMFNKKTNNGQISKLLSLMGIDIKELIYSIAYDYLSPSFISGAGELLRDLAETFMCDFGEKNIKTSSEKELSQGKSLSEERVSINNITMTFGEKADSQRAFRWYTNRGIDLYLEFSQNIDFIDSVKVNASKEYVPYPEPIINLGIITSYSIKRGFRYSAEISDLCRGVTYYYRVCDDFGEQLSKTYKFWVEKFQREFEFLILADSQGMVKQDYDVFLGTFEQGIKNFGRTSFVVHMGDFVDDGNNELYWKWVLNSELWAENAIVPLAGNHEAKLSPIALKAKVENSILRHFNIRGLPQQSLSSGAYYSYTYNNALFIVLNTNNMNEYSMLNHEQYCWALDTAKKSDAKWRILLTHKSPYSNGPHHSERDSREIGRQIIELCYEADIDLVIGGHDHVYVRTPVMSWGKCIARPNGRIRRGGISYDVFSNPLGTVFIVPGTSGVKNYKIDKSTTFPTEKILDLSLPVYSRVRVTDEKIFFTAYKYNPSTGKSECIDGIIIEKTIKSNKNLSTESLMKMIDCIADVPWAPSGLKIDRAFTYFKKLDYFQKLSIYNYRKLIRINKLYRGYSNILGGEIEIVRNKREFLNALDNKNIKTIVTACPEIKFENCFGMGNRIIINRDLCIRGVSRLLFVNFIVRDGALLVLGDSVCIDNSRRIISAYHSLGAVEIKDSSCFIMLDYSSIRCFGGVGFRSHGIYISGREASLFCSTESENFSSGEFIYSPHDETYVSICRGKYFSYRNIYTCLSAGKIYVSGGKIGAIKLLPGSKGEVTGGKVMGKDDAIKCMGKFKIYGGIIESESDIGISVSGHNGCLCILPDHKGSVIVNGKEIFIGEICRADPNSVKIRIYRDDSENNYESIGVYSLVKDCYKEKFQGITPIKIGVKDGDILRFEELSKRVIIMGKGYDIPKGKITVKDGAKYCVFSKLFAFNRENEIKGERK